MHKNPNLDLLRAFAILLVIIDHLLLAQKIYFVGRWEAGWIGVIGVYMFFVHTCLVLMWSLERKPHTLDFYIRRVFRIYPLVVVSLAAMILFHAPIGGNPQNYFFYPPWGRLQFMTNLLLVQNLVGGSNLMGVLWSLPLEVDMYLLLPILFSLSGEISVSGRCSCCGVWPLLLHGRRSRLMAMRSLR